jgi:hypothetical protein
MEKNRTTAFRKGPLFDFAKKEFSERWKNGTVCDMMQEDGYLMFPERVWEMRSRMHRTIFTRKGDGRYEIFTGLQRQRAF